MSKLLPTSCSNPRKVVAFKFLLDCLLEPETSGCILWLWVVVVVWFTVSPTNFGWILRPRVIRDNLPQEGTLYKAVSKLCDLFFFQKFLQVLKPQHVHICSEGLDFRCFLPSHCFYLFPFEYIHQFTHVKMNIPTKLVYLQIIILYLCLPYYTCRFALICFFLNIYCMRN